MAKNRLIFTLLLNGDSYSLSRNFRLQQVGSLKWIRDNYDFNSIAFSIDELIVLNVGRKDKDVGSFVRNIAELTKNCFMPIAAGGGIRSAETAFRLFDAGADKLVVNTAIVKDPGLVAELVKIFGGQSIISSIDYKRLNGGQHAFIENGTLDTGLSVEAAVEKAVSLGIGEIYLTSMDRDGTGQGYDVETLKAVSKMTSVPIIASGGVGKFDQLVEGIEKAGVQAVSTANLFNFMVNGLTEARSVMKDHGIKLAEWEIGERRF